jgi:hypothetical protein
VYVKHRLRFKNNVYSDPIKSVVHSESDTMCTQTQIGAQGCNQTQIQAPSVLGLDQQEIQIKANPKRTAEDQFGSSLTLPCLTRFGSFALTLHSIEAF